MKRFHKGSPLLALPLLAGCVGGPAGPQPVAKSHYLGRKMVKFVVDNGSPYRQVRLRNGHLLHYWRSDFGQPIVGVSRRDDYDYCELALETDARQIVRRIYIIEDSIRCAGVLK